MFTRFFLTFTLLLAGWDGATAASFDPNWGTVGVFTDAQTCAGCHRASVLGDTPAVMRVPDAQGEDVSPSYQWQHSMMAHAFDDPYYQAAVEDEATLFAGLAGLVEDTCLTCHTPMAHTNAHQTGTDLSQDASCPLPDGCYRLATASLQDHAREGVSCTLCHQIKSDNLGGADSFSGGFSIAKAGDADAFTIYGPYQNPHPVGASQMQSNTGYTPQFGSQMTSSAHCASCHTLYTTTLDVETDTPTGAEFLEQGPFLEWQNSVYASGASEAQQCQDCHMPDPEPGIYNTRIAVRPNGTVNTQWPERSPFFTHSMVGGNSHMLELLRDNRNALGIETSTTVSGFDEKITQTRDLLQNETAALDITQAGVLGSELAVDVRITNKSGHKLPTAYPSRRIWIQLTARDAGGQVIFESGAADAQGRISTDNARLAPACLAVRKTAEFSNADCFEPHRDVIDDPAQIALYEPVLGDSNGHITHILLHAGSYLKDNRIPPEGFTNSQADSIEPQTRPVGVDNDPDFNTANSQEGSGSDTVHYRIPLGTPNGPYSVEARLLYQAVSPSFVDGLHSSGGRVSAFKQMYTQNPSVIETLATSSADTAPPPSGDTVDLSGTVQTADGTSLCSMVLASGQFMFSCNPDGPFSLTDLPRENDGTVKRQVYVDGFFPNIDVLPDSVSETVVMTPAGACPSYNTPSDPGVFPDSAGQRIDISGSVLLQDTQTPICAMVLANGQFMFSCDGSGSYALNIPLDNNGQFKLQVYADGFAPTIQTFDEFSATNDMRMARTVECQ